LLLTAAGHRRVVGAYTDRDVVASRLSPQRVLSQAAPRHHACQPRPGGGVGAAVGTGGGLGVGAGPGVGPAGGTADGGGAVAVTVGVASGGAAVGTGAAGREAPFACSASRYVPKPEALSHSRALSTAVPSPHSLNVVTS